MSDFKIVKLVDPIYVATNGVAASITGNTAGTPAVVSASTLYLAGGNNITLSQSQNTISINGGAGGGGVAQSAGTQLATSGTVKFADSNGISFGMSNSSQITASYTVPSTAGLISAINVSGGTTSNNLSKITFADSNGLSFGLNGSVLTGTVKTDYQSQGAYLTTARASNDAIGLNTAGTNITATINSSGFSLNAGGYAGTTSGSQSTAGSDIVMTHNTAGLNLGVPKFLTTAQAPGAYLTTARASNDAVGLNTAATNVTWTVNSSGISLNAGAYLTTARASNDAVGLNTAKTNVTWTVNSSGISLDAGNYLTTAMASNRGTDFVQANAVFNGTNASGTIASNAISISVAAPGGGGVAQAAGTQTATSGTVKFADSNGVTFGMSGSSQITASVASQTVQTQNLHNLSLSGNTAGVMAQISSGTLTLAGGNNITLSQNGNAVTISGGAAGAADGVNALVVNGGASTASTTLALSNSNGISFGLNAGTITASHNGLTTARASNDAIGLNTAATNVTWTVNSSGLSLNAGAYLTTAMASNAATISNINISAGTTSNNLSKLTFADSNGISFGLSGNSVITGTVKTDYQSSNANYLTSQSNQAFSASGGSSAFQTLNFANSNGITFSNSNGSVIASHNGLTTARASTDAIGLNTAQSNVTWTANSSGLSLDARGYAGTATGFTGTNVSATMTHNSAGLSLQLSAGAGGGITPVVSNSAGSFSFTTLNFSNANNVTWGTSAGSIVTASVAAPGAAAENNWVNLLGANTAGNTTASGSTIGYSGVNLTLSGTNGSIVNISAPATSSLSATGLVSMSTNGSTISIGVPGTTLSSTMLGRKRGWGSNSVSLGQNSLLIFPEELNNYVSGSIIKIPLGITNSSSAFGAHTRGYTADFAIYTRNSTNSTVLSRHYSTSYTASVSANSNGTWKIGIITGVQNSTSYNTVSASSAGLNLSLSVHGNTRELVMPLETALTPGEYWFAMRNSSSSAGAAGNLFNLAFYVNQSISGNRLGLSTSSTGAGVMRDMGWGIYSTTTGAMPDGISMTQINQYASNPIIYFLNGTN